MAAGRAAPYRLFTGGQPGRPPRSLCGWWSPDGDFFFRVMSEALVKKDFLGALLLGAFFDVSYAQGFFFGKDFFFAGHGLAVTTPGA